MWRLSEIISIIALVLNICIVFVVRCLTTKSENKRFLKSFLIQEIKSLKEEYHNFIQDFINQKIKPKEVFLLLKLNNIKITAIKSILENQKYRLDTFKHNMDDYHINLRQTIGEIPEFLENYKENEPFILNPESTNKILTFLQKHNQIFNDYILLVNKH